MRRLSVVLLVVASTFIGAPDVGAQLPAQPVATFSIVAHDPETGDLGVAVQSKFFGVGAVVPFAMAGVGAVATQSLANTTYGERGLDLLRQGNQAEHVIQALTGSDPDRALRQVGVIDRNGGAHTYTGASCLPWAGGKVGAHYAVQGNILAGPEVVEAMASAFETSSGDLADRMVAALRAGQTAGGDVRGRQSAALLVVRDGAGYAGFDDRYIDLRVDDHKTPIAELARLLDIRHGLLAVEEAQRYLQRATSASADERNDLLELASTAAEGATRLYPGDGAAWLLLAEIRAARGDLEGAVAAGRVALEANPWLKTAILEGLAGSTELVEKLLQDDGFRRLWESIRIR